jgi:MFS family permease
MPHRGTPRDPARPRLPLLFALYFAQGLPFGFQATALPIYLRDRGVSLTAIGFAGALTLPWLLKVFWAPLVDRYGSSRFGHYRSWIVPAQAGLALCAALCALVPAQDALWLLLALVLVMNFFAATQDIAVDGLCVRLLGPGDLGPANAAQVVGYKAGMLTGGGLLVWASARIGWSGLFAAMSALMLAVLAATALLREPPRDGTSAGDAGAGATATLRGILAALRASAATRAGLWLLVIVASYKVGEKLIDAMFTPFLRDLGFGVADIGRWLGTYGMAASLAGSLAGGLLCRRVSLERALWLTALWRVPPIAAEWWLTQTTPTGTAVIAVTVVEHFAGGMLTTAMFAYMMARVDRRIGATHFTLLASVEVLGKSPAAWGSGLIADAYGYAALFGAGLAASVLFVVLLRAGGLSRRT